MTPEVRAAKPEEAEAVLQTIASAFDLNADAARPIFQADPFYDLSHKRVLTLPGAGVVSCLTVVPLALRVGGVPVPTGGVAGVATRPEHQNRGHAGALVAATVPALWDELGYPLSLLHPISAPFYRRFGWETATQTRPWASDPAALPQPPTSARVRPVLADDWPVLCQIHADLTRTGTGACVRDERRWRLIRLPIPNRETWVTEEGGAVTGYALLERGDLLTVLEMHGRTPVARQALVGLLARQPEPVVAWPASLELLSAFRLPVPDVPSEPDAMLRIVDLRAALFAVHAALYVPFLAALGTALTIIAADPLRPVNERPLRLTPGGVLSGSPDSRPWLKASIGTLAQLYLGYRLPSEASAAGELDVDAPETLALADRLFPLRSPYVAPLDQV